MLVDFNNVLFEKGKQIVLTVDKHPNKLRGIKERLISRFQSGLIVDIQPPDLETRIAILMNDAEQNNLNLNQRIYQGHFNFIIEIQLKSHHHHIYFNLLK